MDVDGSSKVGAKDYYTTGQAAKVLGVCVRTVQLWVEEGRISYWLTRGGHRRLNKASVDALVSTADVDADAPVQNGAMRVLIVDDSKSDSRLLRKMLAKLCPDAAVDEADDGFEALLKIGNQCPDVLFVDLDMPNINGFQMLETLGHHYNRNSLKVYVTTSYDEAEVRQRGGIPALVRHVFYKPINMLAFVDVLRGEWSLLTAQ